MAEMNAEYMRGRWPGVFAAAPTPPALDPLAEAIGSAQNELDSVGLAANYSEAVVLLAGHKALLGTPQRASGQHHARAGLVEIDYGREAGETSFLSLYKQLIHRRPELRITVIGEE